MSPNLCDPAFLDSLAGKLGQAAWANSPDTVGVDYTRTSSALAPPVASAKDKPNSFASLTVCLLTQHMLVDSSLRFGGRLEPGDLTEAKRHIRKSLLRIEP